MIDGAVYIHGKGVCIHESVLIFSASSYRGSDPLTDSVFSALMFNFTMRSILPRLLRTLSAPRIISRT